MGAVVPGQRGDMDAGTRVEWERWRRAREQGPGRRMERDRALGREVTREDVRQAARYEGIMRALEQGRTSDAPSSGSRMRWVADSLALDRIEARA